MRGRHIGPNLVKIASVYLVLGLAGGLYVAVSRQYAYISAHSHATLLGWATMAIAGLVYTVFPSCAESRWAQGHFWMHNAGLPILLAGLVLHGAGRAAAEPLLGFGSSVVTLGLVMFTINAIKNARPQDDAAGELEVLVRPATPTQATGGARPAVR